MALTGTDLAILQDNTTATTIAITPGATVPVGTFLVYCLGYDNSSSTPSAGSDPFVSIADARGNTWTSRLDVLIDPGAASAGSTLRVFTCLVMIQLASTDAITVTFSPTTVAKAGTLMKVVGSVGTPQWVEEAQVKTTGSSTTPSALSNSVPVGNMIVGAFAAEAGTTQTLTDDADTTNGTWSASQYAEIGTTTTGMTAGSQRKVQTTTPSTQTYNPTLGISSDWCIGSIQIFEGPLTLPERIEPRGMPRGMMRGAV